MCLTDMNFGTKGIEMAKCFLTGIDVPIEDAYLLDQGAARRALRSLKERVAAMERLLAQFTPRDSVEVYDHKTRKAVVKPQRRLVCQSVASALSALCPDVQIFITWPQFQARGKAIASGNGIAPNEVAAQRQPTPSVTPGSPATTVPNPPKKAARKKKKKKKQDGARAAMHESVINGSGEGHVSAQ